MKIVSVTITLVLVLAVGFTPARAQDKPAEHADAAKGVAGVWALTMLSHQIGLELAQDGSALTGTLLIMGRSVEVEGTFIDGRFDLDGKGKIGDGQGGEPVPIKLEGRLKDDGTLEGTVRTARGLSEWTGERLGRR